MPVLTTLVAETSIAKNTLYSTPAVNLPILIGSAAGSAAVLFWATRPTRGRTAGAAGLVVGVLLATVAFSSVGVYMFIRGYAALLVIGAGLLALAWLERNVLLCVVGLVFSGTALLVNLYDTVNVYYRLGLNADAMTQSQLLAFLDLLLPAVVLIVGGVLAALSGRSAQ
jgi:ornithine cyclodeaminase/alanine dehydrogenase-like protein (mu-crystallin family)